MGAVRNLIREIHRRSLWQVLGIFLAASWAVLQVVELLTDTAGLPDWTPSMALVLLMLGLPVCLATAFVQEGLPGERGDEAGGADRPGGRGDATRPGTTHASSGESPGAGAVDPVPNLAPGTGSLDRPSTRPGTTARLLTWRNAILGGVGAFALLGFSLVAYFVMWSAGIGPVGSLVAQGVIEEGQRVVIADFDDNTGEGLGAVVTEALRVDLAAATNLRPVDRSSLEPTLGRMQVEPGAPLRRDVAREVAVRDGIGAVLEGGVARAGTGYLITAALTDPSTGRSLATFRASADGPDAVISSIDDLSQDVRERSGESLRVIRAGEPLEQVTTPSLEALRLYSEAERVFGTEQERVVDLLQQAVAIDPGFAMAWRKLSSQYNNALRFDLAAEAARNAFEHRDRLTERERYLTEATYYTRVLRNGPRAIAAYQAVLRVDPDNPTALNNLANAFDEIGEAEEAEALLRRAVGGPGVTSTAFVNLVMSQVGLGRYEDAADILRDFETAFPSAEDIPELRFYVALTNGATSRAEEIARSRLDDPSLPPLDRAQGAMWLSQIAYREGRLSAARDLSVRGARLAGQQSPGLESLRYAVAANHELMVGSPDAAADLLVESEDAGGLESLPVSFADFHAGLLARAGLVEEARAVLARTERQRPEEFAGYGPFAAEIWIRIEEGETDGLNNLLERQIGDRGCTGRYCQELERAEVAVTTGDTVTAIELFEQIAGRGADIYPLIGVLDVYATRRLAPLYEEVGDTANAIAAYRTLIDLWENGDAEVKTRVEQYRARISALGG